jgi:hypothetical protein
VTATLEPPTELDARVEEALAGLSPDERAAAEQQLGRILTRRKALHRFPTPTSLARELGGPGIKITPMLRLFDSMLVAADAGYRTRWIVNTPPQETKSTTINQWGMLWLLLRDPSRKIVIASYEQGLAMESTLAVRQIIESYGGGYLGGRNDDVDREDVLGLALDPRRAKATRWALRGQDEGRNGSMAAVGIGSALTGRPANVLVIDDPLKDAEQADSETYRARARNWYQSVATTRLSGATIVIVVQTRWHELDLSGWLLEEDAKLAHPQWSRLVIPAQAEEDDPLGRAPGEYLESVQDRTVAEWEGKRRDVGSRWWFAMYQQRPSPPEGGVFLRRWFDDNRRDAGLGLPELSIVETWVDPADNTGTGDEAGVITLGLGATDSRIYLLADSSAHMTVGRWFRVALLDALRYGSQSVNYERSLSGLKRGAEAAWSNLRYEAQVLAAFRRAAHRALDQDPARHPWELAPPGDVLAEATDHIAREDATALRRREIETDLLELWPFVERVLALPATGIPIRSKEAKGTKTFRAKMVAPVYERGDVVHVGHFPRAESQMASWLESQDSPDRMDAIVHGVGSLASRTGLVTISPAEGSMPARTFAASVPMRRSTRR